MHMIKSTELLTTRVVIVVVAAVVIAAGYVGMTSIVVSGACVLLGS